MSRTRGHAAETAACAFLQAQGCTVIGRNWHCRYGEIDIIAEHGGTLLFVEVKFRQKPSFGGAACSITPAKLAKLLTAAELYLQQYPRPDAPCRVDAVLIEGGNAPVWIQNITG